MHGAYRKVSNPDSLFFALSMLDQDHIHGSHRPMARRYPADQLLRDARLDDDEKLCANIFAEDAAGGECNLRPAATQCSR